MDLLQPLDVALANVRAELALFEARLKQTLFAVQKRADVLGVEMPDGSTSVLTPKQQKA